VPHYVEKDSTRTMGGEEDCWAFETNTGQRIVLLLRVPYCLAVVLCDPPNGESALEALGSTADRTSLRIIEPPAVW
jgi:hypothetical protein